MSYFVWATGEAITTAYLIQVDSVLGNQYVDRPIGKLINKNNNCSYLVKTMAKNELFPLCSFSKAIKTATKCIFFNESFIRKESTNCCSCTECTKRKATTSSSMAVVLWKSKTNRLRCIKLLLNSNNFVVSRAYPAKHINTRPPSTANKSPNVILKQSASCF